MAVASDDFQSVAKDRLHQVRREDFERRAFADDAPIGQDNDP